MESVTVYLPRNPNDDIFSTQFDGELEERYVAYRYGCIYAIIYYPYIDNKIYSLHRTEKSVIRESLKNRQYSHLIFKKGDDTGLYYVEGNELVRN